MWRNAARRMSGAAAGMATAAGSTYAPPTAAAPLRSGAVASASAPSVVARELRCVKNSPLAHHHHGRRRFGYYRNDSGPPPPNNYRRAPPALPNMEGEQMLWSIMGANAFVLSLIHI